MKKLLLFLLTLFVCAIPAPVQNKASMLAGVNAQTGTSYTFAQTDAVYLVTFNTASAVAASLPAPSNTGIGAGSIFSVKNIAAGHSYHQRYPR